MCTLGLRRCYMLRLMYRQAFVLVCFGVFIELLPSGFSYVKANRGYEEE